MGLVQLASVSAEGHVIVGGLPVLACAVSLWLGVQTRRRRLPYKGKVGLAVLRTATSEQWREGHAAASGWLFVAGASFAIAAAAGLLLRAVVPWMIVSLAFFGGGLGAFQLGLRTAGRHTS